MWDQQSPSLEAERKTVVTKPRSAINQKEQKEFHHKSKYFKHFFNNKCLTIPPGLMVESLPNRCSLLRPKQKCSMMWKISTGFSTFPISGSSVIIKSMSTLAWMKSPSVLLRTVPFIPIKQCSWNKHILFISAFYSTITHNIKTYIMS